MFDLLKKIISGNGPPGPEKKEAQIQVAAAVVLLEAAQIDGRCTSEELAHIMHALEGTFGLDRVYTKELVELADREKKNSIDLWQFTSRINQEFSLEGKKLVMEAVWRVIHADGELEKHEDHYAHKLANLLRLTHPEMIAAKIAARRQRGPSPSDS